MTKRIHAGLGKAEGLQNRMQEIMPDICFTQRRTTLRVGYKAVWALTFLQKGPQHPGEPLRAPQSLSQPREQKPCRIVVFNQPTDVAFGKNGEVYVSDGYGNSRVVEFDRKGNFLKAWGKYGTGPGEFNLPHSIAVERQGNVYVGIARTSGSKSSIQTGIF